MNRTLLAILLLLAAPFADALIFPDKPPPEHFYVDEAGIIDSSSGKQIDSMAGVLLEDEQVPIYMVTIHSLASQNAASSTIEKYATALFNHWGIGFEDRNSVR
jgi:uncharacterized membrane protein YgcG